MAWSAARCCLRADLSADARAEPCSGSSASSRSQKASTSFVRRGQSIAGGGFLIMGLGPDREAALVGRLVQCEVLGRVRRPEYFHLVQMQVVVARQLNPHKAGRLIGELDGQRLVVAEAIEGAAVMAIDGRPTAAIVGQARPGAWRRARRIRCGSR